MLPPVNRQEFRNISKVLFVLGVPTVLCCVTPYSFLSESFYSSVGDYDYSDDWLFRMTCSAPLAKYQHTVRVSPRLATALKESTLDVPLFSCQFRSNHYPLVELNKENLQEKWEKEIEAMYCDNASTAVIPGGYIIAAHSTEYSATFIAAFFRQYNRRIREKKLRAEELKKVVKMSPNTLVMVSTSKSVGEILCLFGNMVIQFGDEKVTISRMTEIIADNLRVHLTALKETHETALQRLANHQREAFKQLADQFFANEASINQVALEQQHAVMKSLKNNWHQFTLCTHTVLIIMRM